MPQDTLTSSPSTTNGSAAGIAAKPAAGAPAKAGLEDVVAGTSEICFLDGKRGILSYRGYDIHDLVKGTFEETVYLLLYGKLPNAGELKEFSGKLVASRNVPQQIKDRLAQLPKNI
ncbi:MAG TPA: citrate/2-methylcitrate synthase, partial [Candidatus Kapabacteria bacterium]